MSNASRSTSAPPFRIKVCGVTRLEDVELVCASGADAIGLNFYPRSSRYVTIDQARQLRDRAGDRLRVVGVWVNELPERIESIADQLRLDAVQLHGTEPLETMRRLSHLRLIRTIRFPFSEQLTGAMTDPDDPTCRPAAVLVDAAVPGQYGGTGTQADWESIGQSRQQLGSLPMILAGGLTPQVVHQALRLARPDAVDVASGVEQSPGVKDRALVEQFVAAVRDQSPWVECSPHAPREDRVEGEE